MDLERYIIRIKLLKYLPFLILAIILSGCATTYNAATGRNEIIFINSASEAVIGESAAAQITEKYKLIESGKDIDRLNMIGSRIAAVSDRQDLEYKFYIIDDKELNAFTIPGGHVYIFKGLYDELDDDELSAVMAHEIGHVAARHIVKKMQVTLGYQVLSTVALIAYTSNADDDKKKQAGYAAYAGVMAFNLVALGYSRKDEFEADELSIKYTSNAGFDPQGMIGALEKLNNQANKGLPVPYILRSHPYIDQRITHLEELIETRETSRYP